MPTLVTEQGIVHYETYGRGRPVILLHGWLGSWALWRHTIEELGKSFRTYAIDFFGFGDSMDRSSNFSVANYVELVHQVMERLGIGKAALIGHSMGGTVSMGVAARYPEKVVKLVVVGSPINGASLNFLLKLSGYKTIADLLYAVPFVLNTFIYGFTHFGVRDGAAVYDMVRSDASKVTADSFFQSIGTLRKTNLTNQLATLQMPIMGIYGRKDIIVNPNQRRVLEQHVPHSRPELFKQSGHFPMMDEPQHFYDTLNDFLHHG